MILYIEWSRPLRLRDASKKNLIYDTDTSKVPSDAGVYIFGRRWGSQFEALYVGKAGNIRNRLKNQFTFNLRLMQSLRNAKGGKRVVLAGKLITQRGQRLQKCLALAERALIRHFLSQGDDLVNIKGARLRRHELESSGQHPKRFFPRTIFLERAKGE